MNGAPAAAWPDALGPALAAALPAFLPRQRWFAGRARGLRAAELEDAAALPGGTDDVPICALALVRARYADGGSERYAMLVAPAEDPGDAAVIALPGAWAGPGALVEACTLEPCARALLAGFATGAGVRHATRAGAALVHADMRGAGPFAVRPLATRTVRPLGAEQSNTSLRVDREYVFKLFRRVEPGENPEVEVGRFLTARTAFRAMPVLHGSLSLEASGVRHTVGVLQSFVASEGDGWAWTLARLAEGGAALPDAMRALGEVTADFHLALASDAGDAAFAPRPLTAALCAAWSDSVAARLGRALGMLERMRDGLPPPARALAEALLGSRGALEARTKAPGVERGGFATLRIHGDYHLGQTLRVPGGFVLMDFEGEPARPLAERRAHAAAMKDVAGMLRSFDYAAAAADTPGPEAAEPLRAAYLAGYHARAAGAAFLPAAAETRAAWIAFFELEKALYEVEYEIGHRPDWLAIPLRGLARLIAR